MCLKKPFALMVFVTAILGSASQARAQFPMDCGGIYTDHLARQVGQWAYYELIVKTWRDINTCPLQVQSEGWVDGYVNAVATPDRGVFFSQTSLQMPANYGKNTSTGKHWVIFSLVDWWFWGNTIGEAWIIRPEPTPEEMCMWQGGQWNYSSGQCDFINCPIIVDVSEDGYELTDARNGVLFDIDGDGDKERVAWTDPKGDEAFLVMDRNGNGKIDDGTELFGDSTPLYAAVPGPRTPNGFVALFTLERSDYGGGSADGVIDQRDAAFDRLYLWRDANHDGMSQSSELTQVSRTGIVGFGTAYDERKKRDKQGNEFRLKGALLVRDKNGKVKESEVWDIWPRRES